DDYPDVRLAFRFMLEAHGYVVSEAANGAEALSQLETAVVDVILTDLFMPDVDGLALVKAVRHGTRRQPWIIAISGAENIGKDLALDAAKEPGADAILPKPVSKDRLVTTIRELLARDATPGVGGGARS